MKYPPSEIIESEGCEAEMLSLSDQHVNFLLSHIPKKGITVSDNDTSNDSNEAVKSLLKLTRIPCHKRKLESIMKDNVNNWNFNVLSYLNQYDFRLTSESGAEYSFYEALQKPPTYISQLKNLFKGLSSISEINEGFSVEFISPASERQIMRARPSAGRCLIQETPELYEAVTKPFIQSQLGSLTWLHNIIEGKKEIERILYNGDKWILNVDTKWRSHPNPSSVSRESWFNHPSTSDLYCLGIFKSGITCLREINSEHIPILSEILIEGSRTIQNVYGVHPDQLKVYVHYQPQFYHFHVHFTRLENEIGASVDRAHLLSDIIQNLEIDSDYYLKRTISYVLPINNKLYQLIDSHKNE